MVNRIRLMWILEVLWWVLTAFVAIAVIWPIRKAMLVWPFQTWNVIFVISLVTFARYLFFLSHTFLGRRQVLKFVSAIVLIPAIFLLVQGINEFLRFIENNTWEPLTGHLPVDQRLVMDRYIWSEMLFFGVGSVLTAAMLVIRLFSSIWRLHNRGRV